MKTSFLLLMYVMITTVGFSQKPEGGKVVLQETILDSLQQSKEKLRVAVKEWLGITFIKAKDVINSETENGFVCRYSNVVRGSTGEPTAFRHTMTVDIKENKIRVRITADESDRGYPAAMFFYPENGKPKKIWLEWLRILMNDSAGMVASLEESLTKKDDW